MSTFSNVMPWVIFNLLDEQFAVSTSYVKEMVAMPKVVTVPRTPDYIKGVINLRGKVIPVMDLRIRMGMESMSVEVNKLIQLLDQREQDHKNWMKELESSVRENREFKLATDPHKCAFGKWYDNYETGNNILASCLAKFDVPHKKIHSIAINVKTAEEKKDFDLAYEIINQTKEKELSEILKLFSEARTLLKESIREIALVLEWENKIMAVGVDSVKTVEKLSESNIEDLPGATSSLDNESIAGIGKRSENNGLIQLLDVGILINEEKDLAVESLIETE